MTKSTIYILGNYRVGAADGLAEFNYQTVHLLKDEFEFQFVEFDDTKKDTFFENKMADSFQVNVFGSKDVSFYRLPTAFLQWIKQLKSLNTVFHLSHIYNLTNFKTARLLIKQSIPYLITPHDSFVYSAAYAKDKPVLKRWYRKMFVNIFDKYVLDNANVIHGISPQCLHSLQEITKTPVQVVYNQVQDTNLPYNIADIKKQVCFIGRFDIYRKGIDIALQAFSLFKKNTKNSEGYKFILIGPADEAAKEAVNKLCSELNLKINEDVVLPGKLPVSERDKLLSQSKMYMQLSRTEGFGLSIAQALSCFKPTIISKQIPIQDKIDLYNAGYVVNSAQEAANAILQIENLSPAEYEKMSFNARTCYEKEFHPNVLKPQLIHLYKKALNSSTKA